MSRIVLISCVSKKLAYKTIAKNLYISPLFRGNLAYAQSRQPDKIFILSAKYGLVKLEQELEPYNQTLNEMSATENKQWAKKVLEQMHEEMIDFENDEVIFLAGEKYRKNLLSHFHKASIPLQGLGIGRQLKYLKEQRSL